MMIIDFIVLIGINVANAVVDAKLIGKWLRIYHGINFVAYFFLTGLLVFRLELDAPRSILFCLASFFIRQIVFDTSLNIERGLSPYYVSTQTTAIWDRIEYKIVSSDGKKQLQFYSIGFYISILFLDLLK